MCKGDFNKNKNVFNELLLLTVFSCRTKVSSLLKVDVPVSCSSSSFSSSDIKSSITSADNFLIFSLEVPRSWKLLGRNSIDPNYCLFLFFWYNLGSIFSHFLF